MQDSALLLVPSSSSQPVTCALACGEPASPAWQRCTLQRSQPTALDLGAAEAAEVVPDEAGACLGWLAANSLTVIRCVQVAQAAAATEQLGRNAVLNLLTSSYLLVALCLARVRATLQLNVYAPAECKPDAMQAAISRGFQQLEEQLQDSGLVFVLSSRWVKHCVKLEVRTCVSRRARTVADRAGCGSAAPTAACSLALCLCAKLISCLWCCLQ